MAALAVAGPEVATTSVAIAAVAAAGLPAASPPEPVVVHAVAWPALHAEVRRWNIPGLLAVAVRTGTVVLPEEAWADAERDHLEALTRCLAVEARLLRIVGALDAAGIEHRVLKGTALAHLDYRDPAERCFADADVLVPDHRYAEAQAVLEQLRLSRERPPVRRWWDQRFAKGATFRDAAGFEADLHRTLASGRFGFALPSGDLFADEEAFRLGGRELLALPATLRLVHAGYHAVLGMPSGLRGLRDVAQLLLVTGADWEAAVRVAERWGSDAVLAEAFRRTWRQLALEPGHPALEWASSHLPPVEQVAAMAAAASGGLRAEVRAALPVVPGWHRKALYLAGPAFPSRANLRSRHLTLLGYLRSRLQGRA